MSRSYTQPLIVSAENLVAASCSLAENTTLLTTAAAATLFLSAEPSV